ncbi:hypothetical protein KJY74_24725 [Klebsiella pneumoniae subsp. pneumoniae]|uniref:AvrD family protein n=1 Tax=Klebsiella pneumoniae TaxID=573 RepID=UPI0021B4B353|nr:AvrD family protein [Klebsiella pneumoniae]MCT6795041.1 hypothetical protein [Klebsiella pneumoniae subsp. pneumoniae]
MANFMLSDVDEYLGDSKNRFFGGGYKKVSYRILKKNDDMDNISSLLTINYPDNWSVKRKGKNLKPHLSSIDVIITATNLCGELLNKSGEDICKYFIAELKVKAGKHAVEDLDSIESWMSLVDEKGIESFFKGMIGNMKVEVRLQRKINDDIGDSENMLKPSFINGEFKDSSLRISDVVFMEGNIVTAYLLKKDKVGKDDRTNILDFFLSALQLGQVLLYELDCLKRENSNNLWMRSLYIKKHDKEMLDKNIEVRLENSYVSMNNNLKWRHSDIVSRSEGVDFVCAVAHVLP